MYHLSVVRRASSAANAVTRGDVSWWRRRIPQLPHRSVGVAVTSPRASPPHDDSRDGAQVLDDFKPSVFDVARGIRGAVLRERLFAAVDEVTRSGSGGAASHPPRSHELSESDVASLIDRCHTVAEVRVVLEALCVDGASSCESAEPLLAALSRFSFATKSLPLSVVAARWERSTDISDREKKEKKSKVALTAAEWLLLSSGRSGAMLQLKRFCECPATDCERLLGDIVGRDEGAAEVVELLRLIPTRPCVSLEALQQRLMPFRDDMFGAMPEAQLEAINSQLSAIGAGSGPSTVL